MEKERERQAIVVGMVLRFQHEEVVVMHNRSTSFLVGDFELYGDKIVFIVFSI
jgi:hypothetical protein